MMQISTSAALQPYPKGPGHRNVDTSMAAAEAVAGNEARNEAIVFSVLQKHPHGLIASEIAAMLGWEITSVRPRLTGLKNKAKVRDSGVRRAPVATSGEIILGKKLLKQIVWVTL